MRLAVCFGWTDPRRGLPPLRGSRPHPVPMASPVPDYAEDPVEVLMGWERAVLEVFAEWQYHPLPHGTGAWDLGTRDPRTHGNSARSIENDPGRSAAGYYPRTDRLPDESGEGCRCESWVQIWGHSACAGIVVVRRDAMTKRA